MNRFWYKGASIINFDVIDIRFIKYKINWFDKNRIKNIESSIRIVR